MKPWKTLSRNTILDHSKWLRVEEHSIELPDGRRLTHWPWIISPDYVNIVVVDNEGLFVCFRQTKYAAEGVTLAPAGGYLEEGEAPIATAERELREEMGLAASEWHHLGSFPVDGNHGAGKAHLYLALGTEPAGNPVADDLEEQVLVRLSHLVADLAEVCEIDINPLLADADGAIALDARMRIAPAPQGDPTRRLAIRPYPQELEETVSLDGRSILLRPIRPEDAPAQRAFLAALDSRDIRFRFFGAVRDFRDETIARWTQIDYDREMAFIATEAGKTLGVVRTITDPDNVRAEFAVVVGSGFQHKGLGRALMEKMIAYTRARGTETLAGEIMADNDRMLALMRRLGFTLAFTGHNLFEARLSLGPSS